MYGCLINYVKYANIFWESVPSRLVDAHWLVWGYAVLPLSVLSSYIHNIHTATAKNKHSGRIGTDLAYYTSPGWITTSIPTPSSGRGNKNGSFIVNCLTRKKSTLERKANKRRKASYIVPISYVYYIYSQLYSMVWCRYICTRIGEKRNFKSITTGSP